MVKKNIKKSKSMNLMEFHQITSGQVEDELKLPTGPVPKIRRENRNKIQENSQADGDTEWRRKPSVPGSNSQTENSQTDENNISPADEDTNWRRRITPAENTISSLANEDTNWRRRRPTAPQPVENTISSLADEDTNWRRRTTPGSVIKPIVSPDDDTNWRRRTVPDPAKNTNWERPRSTNPQNWKPQIENNRKVGKFETINENGNGWKPKNSKSSYIPPHMRRKNTMEAVEQEAEDVSKSKDVPVRRHTFKNVSTTVLVRENLMIPELEDREIAKKRIEEMWNEDDEKSDISDDDDEESDNDNNFEVTYV